MNGFQENQPSTFVRNVIAPIGIKTGYKEVPLTQGKVALVDRDDFEELMRYRWQAHEDYGTRGLFYAVRGSKTIFMHHQLIGKPVNGLVTDHIDGNGLNNQRGNLRHVSNRVNMQNMHSGKKHSTYPGVTYSKHCKKWMSQIKINGKSIYIGVFESEIEAHAAYMNAQKNL